MTSPHHVLWTGGWDSTFRVLDLAIHHQRVVQPWYIVDWQRRSTHAEQAAIRQIREQLGARDPASAARIKMTAERSRHDFETDEENAERLRRLKAKSHIGIQYGWLSRFAEESGLAGLELGVHAGDGAVRHLRHNVTRHDAEPPDDYWELAADPVDRNLELFRPFRFPLFDLTKLDMARLAEQRGFADLLEMTWFCHHPTRREQPCGWCNPCRHTRDDGLGRRVPGRLLGLARRRARDSKRWTVRTLVALKAKLRQ